MSNQPQDKQKFWFLLGREPLLSSAEIFSLLGPKAENFKTSSPFLFFQGTLPEDFISKLGGTIKIASEIKTKMSEGDLLATLHNLLADSDGKITFGISLYGEEISPKLVETWGKRLKKDLKSEGRSVRYVFKNENNLSSVTVDKNRLIDQGHEFLVFKKNREYSVAKTTAVQPFESFGERDFGRPGRDSFSGMLPPKLALMMLNIASQDTTDTVLDPFCGSGTIITEALLRGYKKIYGTDLSEKAIEDTKKNLEWLKNTKNLDASQTKIEVCDAKKLSIKLNEKISAIATEPFLGKPLRGNESVDELQRQSEELKSLYLDVFEEFKKILKLNATVVFIFPQFISNDGIIRTSEGTVEKLKKIGFSPTSLLPKELGGFDFILYRRPDQRVGREIWKFKLN